MQKQALGFFIEMGELGIKDILGLKGRISGWIGFFNENSHFVLKIELPNDDQLEKEIIKMIETCASVVKVESKNIPTPYWT